MNLGLQEMLVVAVIALLVFGPERLPEMARDAAKMLARLRRETESSVAELKRAADVEDLERELKGISRDLRDVRSSVSGALTEDSTAASENSTAASGDVPPPVDPEAT